MATSRRCSGPSQCALSAACSRWSTVSGSWLSWNAAAARRAGTASRWKWSRRSVCFCATTHVLDVGFDGELDDGQIAAGALGCASQEAICGGEDAHALRICPAVGPVGRSGPVHGAPLLGSWLSMIRCRRSRSARARWWRGEGASDSSRSSRMPAMWTRSGRCRGRCRRCCGSRGGSRLDPESPRGSPSALALVEKLHPFAQHPRVALPRTRCRASTGRQLAQPPIHHRRRPCRTGTVRRAGNHQPSTGIRSGIAVGARQPRTPSPETRRNSRS